MSTTARPAVQPVLGSPDALPRVDGDRLWRALMTLAQIGATPKGGVCRLALTALDGEARRLVMGWLREAGATIEIDAIGNIFATRAGRRDVPAIGIGSHIDTQPTGGRFDGNYGVLAGLELLRTLDTHQITTEHPITVAIWTNEEGSRFTPVMMGSGVYAGEFTLEHCLVQEDLEGIRVADALEDIDAAGTAVLPQLSAYFEPHIEQGPILEREGRTIGIVTGALGQRWFDARIIGQDAHAGPTPIEARRDALLAAARLVVQVRELALRFPDEARATVGQLLVSPNSRNVVPGQVRLSIDLRSATSQTLDAMVAALHRATSDIEATDGVSICLDEVVSFPPCRFDDALVASIAQATAQLGYPSRDIVSGAGHDAVHLASVCPSAMIFVPCENGISHNEIENAQPADLEAGANVLLHAVLAIDGRPSAALEHLPDPAQ
ncbi:MAG: Zn-dependent hydrolase [Burkholderiaceae bacterium]|nr:Zn-dependent hydrolase [Burkholderiaceae bacterium]